MNKILKYSEFINEKRSVLTEVEWIKLFKEHCTKYTHYNNYEFFRATKDMGDYALYTSTDETDRDTKAFNKKSLWLFEMTPWRKYPNRLKSLIFSTSMHEAKNFERINKPQHIIIPFDNAEIGITSGRDFNVYSFKSFNNLVFLNNYITDMTEKIGVFNFDYTLPKIKNIVNRYYYNRDNINPRYDKEDIFILNEMKKGKTAYEALEILLSPEHNEFELITFENNKIGGTHECWTSNNCLMVKVDKYDELVKKGVIVRYE